MKRFAQIECPVETKAFVNLPWLWHYITSLSVETDPGHDYWRKLAKVCQADLDLKDWCIIHGNIWPRSEGKFRFFEIKILFV